MNGMALPTNPVIDLASTTAGRRAIAGFLLQILRSIQLGMEMTVTFSPLSDTTQMVMHLEPAEGGDVQVLGGPRDIVEQVKMRTPNGRWTSGEVGAKVLPDLLRAVRPATYQTFRFVTNNGAGLGPLVDYIASRGRAAPVRQRWGAARISTAEFELRLAKAAGLSGVTADMRHLLDNLKTEIVDPVSIEEEIDRALTPLLRPDDHPTDRRHQLLGQLMLLATEGAQLSPADLLGLVSSDAHRLLAHIHSLPSLVSRHLKEDALLIGYDRLRQARRVLPEPVAELVVLSGESGQGKTWTLAQLAFDQTERGELAVVMRAPTRLDDVVASINERIWQPAHPEHVTIPVMARSIGQALDRGDGTWLTVYIDDVQDRTFAQRLEREGRLHHPLSFLPTLTEPWQFDALCARAGTAFETELVRFASARRGRRSMTRDTTGNECERILAMIGGDGYDRLVLTELDRPNQFGRQDGFVSARWTASTAIGEALSTSAGESDTESYGAVVRMEALAVHARDAELEGMVRAGTSIYVSAAEMRSSGGRDVSTLRTRIAALLQSSDDVSLDTAAALTGFLQDPEDALPLLPTFLDPATSVTIRRRILASCRALGFYAPEMLPIARSLINGQSDEEAQFVVAYLAEDGDEDARCAATDWLDTQGLSGSSNFRQNLLPPLLRHEDSRPTVLAYLQTHRAGGGLIADGGLLKLLAEAGDAKAQDELLRATQRYTGFARQNTIVAIGFLRHEEPEEAYFAAQRLLSRHQVAAAADLMLEIDPERASRELIERYRRAPPSLRLEIERRLRVHLGGEAFAMLIAPLANSVRAGDREMAADLAGAVPSGVHLPWLDTLAGNPSPAARRAAQSAIRQRRLEAAALIHRDLIRSSSKPLRWARLSTIFDIVDPFYLWARDDPASLEQVFGELDYEFLSAARQMRTKALKVREDEAKKQDKRR